MTSRIEREDDRDGTYLSSDTNYDEDGSDPTIEEDLDKLPSRIERVDMTPKLLDRLERRVAADALTVFEAFSRFCAEELQVEAKSLLRVAFEPIYNGLEKLTTLKETLEIEPDEEKAKEYLEELSECWSKQRAEFERLL